MRGPDVLLDLFERLPDLVRAAVEDLDPDHLRWTPGDRPANPIGWLVWHLTRVQDHHVSEVADREQAYGEFAARFGLPADPHDTGYGHQPKQVTPDNRQALVDYHRAVHDRTVAFVRGLSDADLDRVVDTRWDPPVTLGVRLASVYDDAAQHLGQAAYLRGLLDRQ